MKKIERGRNGLGKRMKGWWNEECAEKKAKEDVKRIKKRAWKRTIEGKKENIRRFVAKKEDIERWKRKAEVKTEGQMNRGE